MRGDAGTLRFAAAITAAAACALGLATGATTVPNSPPVGPAEASAAVRRAPTGAAPAVAPRSAVQRRVTVPDYPNCTDCRLALKPFITLTDAPDATFAQVGATSSVVQDSSGRLYLSHDGEGAQIMVFDAEGRFLRSVGRRGEGPGEFTWIMNLAMFPGDELHAFDYIMRRETVFSPALEVVDTFQLPARVRDLVPFEDGSLVVAARQLNVGLEAMPLELLDARREPVLAFGADAAISMEDPTRVIRNLARAGERSVWSAAVNRYVLEEWGLDGAKRRELVRSPDWFAPWEEERAWSLRAPRQPWLRDLRTDEEGRIWILVAVPGERWADGLVASSEREGGVQVVDVDLLWDAHVEVIDPEAGRVIVSQRLPQYLLGFSDRGYLIGYREGPDGIPYLDLWTSEIVGGE